MDGGDETFHSLHVLLCRWLDRNEDDGQITRELVPFIDGQRLYSKWEGGLTFIHYFILSLKIRLVSDVGYQIVVKTGDIPGGSSDSNVFVKLYGEKGDTDKMMLVVSTNNLGNYFETGRVDIFTVETFDIGQVFPFGVDERLKYLYCGATCLTQPNFLVDFR